MSTTAREYTDKILEENRYGSAFIDYDALGEALRKAFEAGVEFQKDEAIRLQNDREAAIKAITEGLEAGGFGTVGYDSKRIEDVADDVLRALGR